MNRRLEAGWKRITSGFLAFTIVSILILGNSGIAFAEEYDDRFYREETDLSELGEFSKATVSNASFKNSKKDDVVIITGKGHETYQIIGKVKHHFDDKEVANECLSKM